MRIRHLHRTGSTMLGLFAVMLMFASAPASAQKFEEMFGGECFEYGFSGIGTSDGGYISVGSATSHNSCVDGVNLPNVDIYIVKLNANGSLAWSRTIDIGRGNDIARDVIESRYSDRPTYLITGYTNRSGCDNMGGQDIWLLRIDNSGTLQWLNTYGTSDYDELAFRLVECRTTVGDERGEVAIAGYRSNSEGNRLDGLLLRTTPNGGIVYFHAYGGDGDDGFYGLIESQVGDNAGDLVLAGFSNSWNESGGTEGWAVRVGPRGDFYGRPAGSATYGRQYYCRLTHVAEVTATREDYGRLIFCGDATLDDRVDPYFLKTEAWPCRNVADIRWGDNRDSYEETWSIREIHDPNGTGLNHGNFIVAGTTDIPNVGTTTYPYMMEIDPGLGLVSGVGMKYYGRTQGWGYTAWPVPGTRLNNAGFYLTATAYDFVAGHGSLQMYVVKSDNTGVTDCTDRGIDPRRTEPAFEPNCVDVPYERTGDICEHRLEAVRQRWIDVICNDSDDGEGLGKIADIDLSGLGMDVYPNPVTAGSALTVSAVLHQAGPMTVTVVDMAGHEIHRVTAHKAKGAAAMEVKTDGWASGTCIVTMTVDGQTRQMQVVIAR